MSISEVIEMIQDIWRHEAGSTLGDDVVVQYLVPAIRHVETFDYVKSNAFTVDGTTITFSTTPSTTSMMLYGYKALELLQRGAVNGELEDDKLGITFKSCMDSISTSGAGRIRSDLLTNFIDQYKSALNAAKKAGHTPLRIDLYDD